MTDTCKRVKNIFTLACALCFTLPAQCQSYTEQVAKSLRTLDTARAAGSFAMVAARFEAIALTEKKEWLPYYYAGLSNVLAAFQKKGKDIDALCDKADKLIGKADSLNGDLSEMEVLKSMAASARINVNAMARGRKYGGEALSHAELAIRANPGNPRAYLQKGTAIYYTPEMFGGGPKKAKPVMETALEKFKSFRPQSKLWPRWGKDQAEQLLKTIDQKIKTK